MARFLICLAIFATTLFSVPKFESAFATHTSRGPTQSTGYAYGSLTGASAGTLTQGHFANHWSVWCPGDPAAVWPTGTSIWSISPQPTYYGGASQTLVYTTQTLKDIGDSNCIRPNYWVDFYFGRWKFTPATCSCGNATESCWDTSSYVLNCQDASNWGAPTAQYYTSSQ